jgi:hypothetical protein
MYNIKRGYSESGKVEKLGGLDANGAITSNVF